MTTVLPDTGARAAAADHVALVAARWSRGVVVVVLAATAVLAVAGVVLPPTLVLALAGVGLLAGLPHGSVDHVVGARLTGRPVLLVAAAYGVGAVLAWLLMAFVGPVAIVAVLLLSAAHFGLGELEVVRQTSGWHPSRTVSTAVAVAGTGALLLPLARAGDLLGGVAVSVSPAIATVVADPVLRVGLAVVWGAAALVAGAAAVRARRWEVVLDVALVGALGLLVSPLLAFAVWFGAWHGLRHCARMLGTDPACAALLAQGRPARAAGELARTAAWPTLAATLTLAGLVVLTTTASDPTAAVGGTLVVLLALTVPHMVVVRWLDARSTA